MAKFSRSKPRSKDAKDYQHDTDEKDGACYICHQTGHLAEHCPDRKSSYVPLFKRDRDAKVNAIHGTSDDDHEDHYDDSDSDSPQSEN